jgi:hypothetical protein
VIQSSSTIWKEVVGGSFGAENINIFFFRFGIVSD